jgi:hypothetical protein
MRKTPARGSGRPHPVTGEHGWRRTQGRPPLRKAPITAYIQRAARRKNVAPRALPLRHASRSVTLIVVGGLYAVHYAVQFAPERVRVGRGRQLDNAARRIVVTACSSVRGGVMCPSGTP